MCGIVGIISDKPVIKHLVSSLNNLTYRGYDSAGIVVNNGENLYLCKEVGYVENLNVDFSQLGKIGIGHTRWATHGKVTKENAHPHLGCFNKIAIVHNGIIENYEKLKILLRKRGHVFKSETDSEVIVHLIEHYNICHDFNKAFQMAVRCLKGSYAIVAIHKDYSYLMVARKESPLMVGTNDSSVYVASDVLALGSSNFIREFPNNSVEALFLNNNNSGTHFNLDVVVNKGDYSNYMLKEIYEQPESFRQALKQDKNTLIAVSLDILRATNVIWTACGTSRFASIVGRYLIAKIGKCMSETIVGSELHYFENSFDSNTLILALSQSGETADVISGVKLAKIKGSRIISVINKSYSSLERLSDVTLFMNCGVEIAVASTKSFTNELAICYLLAYTMASKYESGMAELLELPEKIKECLVQASLVQEVSGKIKDVDHIYFVGKGINFAVSGECALKLKEVSYIHAESMSAGELKHGTLSLVEKGTPIIGLCPDDNTHQETIANLHEAKARGGYIIGISDLNDNVFDSWLPIPKVKDIFYPVVCVIIGQLLAYYTAVNKGLNPDRPRNLAKSVTVH